VRQRISHQGGCQWDYRACCGRASRGGAKRKYVFQNDAHALVCVHLEGKGKCRRDDGMEGDHGESVRKEPGTRGLPRWACPSVGEQGLGCDAAEKKECA